MSDSSNGRHDDWNASRRIGVIQAARRKLLSGRTAGQRGPSGLAGRKTTYLRRL